MISTMRRITRGVTKKQIENTWLWLAEELPDAKQELFPQPLHLPWRDTLLEFHIFPKLPIELRLEIWRATFPRRTIFLNIWTRYESARTMALWIVNISPSLGINSESARETLRHYQVFDLMPECGDSVPTSVLGEKPKMKKWILFNRELDTIKIPCQGFLLDVDPNLPELWEATFAIKYTKFVQAIKYLELYVNCWSGRKSDFIEACQPLKQFGNLSVFAYQCCYPYPAEIVESWQDHVNLDEPMVFFFETLFASYAAANPKFSTPKVLQRNGRAL